MLVNLFKRLYQHLFILPSAVNRHFSTAAMQRIEAAIAQSEATHFGEIRFVVECNLSVMEILQKKSAKKRAVEVFSQIQVWDTEQNNGVLIYLLIADHDFEILADRGIHHHVGNQVWEHISHEMEVLFRQGQFEAGVLHGIAEISTHLRQHYPATAENHNELPNAPVII
ncbi:MAG: TPM domain-containing protein [Methylotenera sp.]|nr:TPM domain-containing protein [Methylotenera sp.]MDO9388499.1 TPM domain-containing protein [Methylotenera sp.]